MRMRPYGLWKCLRGIFCELFTFTTSICGLFLELNELYWVLRSTNVLFKSTIKVSLLWPLSPLRGQSFLS